MKIIRKQDLTTRKWSGGTTTELAIWPEGAVYAERDFLWRLSTAEVLDETSTFTSLPDYYRFLTTRKGNLKIRHDGGEWYELTPGKITGFEGGSLTESEGRVTDFNLMVRKDKVEGNLSAAILPGTGEAVPVFTLFRELAGGQPDRMAALYASDGALTVAWQDREITLGAGEMILFGPEDPAGGCTVRACGETLVLCAMMDVC